MSDASEILRRNLIAQWAFDTRSILLRFHIKLEDVEESWIEGEPDPEDQSLSFVGPGLDKALIMTTAVTALGTRLFGRHGEAHGLDKAGLNRVKKDADAVSAYAMSEGLWYLTRNLPENHAIMVSLGEGLMPKVGETPEMGSNPLLGFGRVYARPQVARFLDRLVLRLINEPGFGWEEFMARVQAAGITIWGAAIDTLENTSRFAKGAATGPLAVLHLFDQPLKVALPYEGYMGCLALPKEVVERAAEESVLIDYLTPRAKVMEAIRQTYPGILPENVHVWTLGGRSRVGRIGRLWEEWKATGAHLVEDGWTLPTGLQAFIDSGTYAPTFLIGAFEDPAQTPHIFLCDGYSASAEAIQAASLDPVLGLETSICIFSSRFQVSYERERLLMHLQHDAEELETKLGEVLGRPVGEAETEEYRAILRNATEAGMPLTQRTVRVDDFFPQRRWRVLALCGYMLPDPYTGSPGVQELGAGLYRVCCRGSSLRGILETRLTLRLQESFEESRLVFSPLLDRFYAGQDFRSRAVRISDSGRIRNELQTLCSEAIEYLEQDRMRVDFDRVDDAVLPADKKELIREALRWYKENHPMWFRWLEI